MNDFPMRPIPYPEWQNEYDRLMQDSYLSAKYDRERRLKEKLQYVDRLAAEIKTEPGMVLDIGPGPGEFLEVAIGYGCGALGIDSALGESEMGDEYLRLSRLLTFRQGLPVMYVGFDRLLAQPFLPFLDRSFAFINSQGSIEQVFHSHLVGPRHRETKTAALLSWTMNDEMTDAFERFFLQAYRILKPKGHLLIYGNGAANVFQYHEFILDMTVRMNRFEMVFCQDGCLHKMVKKSP